jgi:hypothetical protein
MNMMSSFAHGRNVNASPTGSIDSVSTHARQNSVFNGGIHSAPLVSLRPASSTDAWFILNLLSAVPFLSR